MNLVRHRSRRVASAAGTVNGSICANSVGTGQNLFGHRQQASNHDLMLYMINNKVGCRNYSILNQAVEKKIESEPLNNVSSQRGDDLVSVLHRLDGALFSSSAANADAVIADIRYLAETKNVRVPLGYYMDTAHMLAVRHDAMRMELLLRIAATNLDYPEVDVGTRSRPSVETGWNILVSHSVAMLLRYSSSGDVPKKAVQPSLINYKDPKHLQKLLDTPGNTNKRGSAVGQQLLLRMSKSSSVNGALTSRDNLTQLLDKLIAPAQDQRMSGFPNISDLKGLQKSLHGQLWTQTASHSSMMLRLLRQYINLQLLPKTAQLVSIAQLGLEVDVRKEIKSLFALLQSALQQVDELYFSCQGSVGVEAPAVRLQCTVAALTCLRSLLEAEMFVDLTQLFNTDGATFSPSPSSRLLLDQIDKGVAVASETYRELLQRVEAHADLTHPSTSVMERIGGEICRILSDECLPATKQSAFSSSAEKSSSRGDDVATGGSSISDAAADSSSSDLDHLPAADLLMPRARLREAVSNLTQLLLSLGRTEAAHEVVQAYVSSTRGLKIRTVPPSYAAAITAPPAALSVMQRLREKHPAAAVRLNQLTSRVSQNLLGDGGGKTSNADPVRRWVVQQGEEGEWLQRLLREMAQRYSPVLALLCDVLYATAASPLPVQREQIDSEALADKSLKLHGKEMESIVQLGERIGLSLSWNTAAYNAARIRGLGGVCEQLNKIKLPCNLSKEVALTVPWRRGFGVVLEVIDSADDENGRDSSIVCDAAVEFLCSYKEEEPLRKAISLVDQESVDSNPNISLASHCLIADTAAACLLDEELPPLLETAEMAMRLIQREHSQQSKGSSKRRAIDRDRELQLHMMLSRTRIRSYCRIGLSFEAVQELQKLRRLGGYCERDLYYQVIDGLFHAKAVTDNQSNIANNPRPVVDWLLQEMARDGHFVDDEMAALLLSLLRKACHLAAVLSRNKKQALDDAVDFAKSICIWPTRRQLASDAGYEVEARPGSESELGLDDRQSHYLGHRRLPLAEAEAVCFELLTAFCVGRKERQALEFLKVTVAEMNIKPTARFYEPLLFNYAIVSGEASLSDPRLMVQELYRDMVSHDVPQSDLTVSSIVLCYLKHGSADSPAAGDRVRDAIDMLEDLYNKHKVRPKLNFLILILDYALQIQDVSEARRLVRVAHGMYTPLERASLAAHDFDSYRTTPEDELEDRRCWKPQAPLPAVGRMLHRSTVPGFPKDEAALSDYSLERRFQKYGLSLHPEETHDYST